MSLLNLKAYISRLVAVGGALAIVACGFTPIYKEGALPKVAVYRLDVTGNSAGQLRERLDQQINLQDDAIFGLSVHAVENIYEENIDDKREGARETMHLTLTYELTNREDGSVKKGQLSQDISYTAPESELDARFEQDRARINLVRSATTRLQQAILQIRPQK